MTLRVSDLGLAVLIALTPVPPAVAATSSQKPAAPQTLDLATGRIDRKDLSGKAAVLQEADRRIAMLAARPGCTDDRNGLRIEQCVHGIEQGLMGS